MRRLPGWILEEGARALGRAAEKMASSRQGGEVVARAVGAAQRGLQALSAVQEQALHAVGLAAKPDYDDVRKRLARIKRKVRDIDRKVPSRSDPGDGESR